MKDLAKPVPALRMYEYKDDEGNVYWSFVKHRSAVSPPTRLVLQDRVGEHPMLFVTRLRQLIQAFQFGSRNREGG